MKDPKIIQSIVHWVFDQPNLFLNTSSDTNLLPLILHAASEYDTESRKMDDKSALAEEMTGYAGALEMEPIFIRGVMDGV